MKVQELMVTNVSRCSGTQNLAEIAEILWNTRRGSLPVVNRAGVVESVITDRDVAIALGTRNVRASEIRVSDVVPARIFTCRAEDDVLDALDTMVSQNVRRLPVVDEDNKLAGILSLDDLIRRAAQLLPGEIVFHTAVLSAFKTICDAREPGVIHESAELLAANA